MGLHHVGLVLRAHSGRPGRNPEASRWDLSVGVDFIRIVLLTLRWQALAGSSLVWDYLNFA
jgi:hypothetical protein